MGSALLQINQLLIRTFFVAGTFLTQVNQSSHAQPMSLEIGAGLMAFDYVEYGDSTGTYNSFEGDDNIFLDGESGLIPGVVVKLKTNKRIYYEWEGSLYYNAIEYDGQTQSGIPITTESDALIIDTHFKMGLNFKPSFRRESKIYGGVGYRYWYRNIIPTTINLLGSPDDGKTVAGLLEEYTWFYGLAGYAVQFNASKNVKVGLDFRLTKMFNAKMDVDYLGFDGRDNFSVNLGKRYGARFAVPIEIKSLQRKYTVTPYYEIIDIGISNFVPITRNGVQVGGLIAWEPRSETRNFGVEVTWFW